MNYPYYIVTWQEGRLPCPPQYKGTVIQKQFTKGQIGGKKNIEEQVQTPQEAYAMLCRDRFNRVVYEVPRRNACRRRMRFEEVQREAREQ